MKKILYCLIVFLQSISCYTFAQSKDAKYCSVGIGWAGNTINTAVFRKNSLVTHKNFQYISYYNPDGYLTLGKRKLNSCEWEIKQTPYKGNIRDAHNVISMMVDGKGYLHLAWDHHNGRLKYTRSRNPSSLELLEQMEMTGIDESRVTYPEFYKLPNGNLLFFYRSGASGAGNLIINQYDANAKIWTRLHSNLISGEGKRNAYWQAFVDNKGTIHISWVWRESPDVASNHDMAYARSRDGGISWEKSDGKKYSLPITLESAEYAARIPQKAELINQTSMCADKKGNPLIATYYKESGGIPQYKLIYLTNGKWHTKSLDFKSTSFSLSGVGTKSIPISRPQIMVKGRGEKASVILVFRDNERLNKASVANIENLQSFKYQLQDLNQSSLGSWEPTYDTELWRRKGILHLFVQKTEQKDSEGVIEGMTENVGVIEWKP